MAATPEGTSPSQPAAAAVPEPMSPTQRLADAAQGAGQPPDVAAESPLWEGRTHWTHFAGTLALGLAGVTLTTVICLRWRASQGIFQVWLAVCALCAVCVAVRILWSVLVCRYRLTTQRLFVDRGIFSRVTDQTELIRVDDVRVRQSLTDRIFGLGSVEILSTDLSDRSLVIDGVRDPATIAEHIRAHMRVARRNSLYVENL